MHNLFQYLTALGVQKTKLSYTIHILFFHTSMYVRTYICMCVHTYVCMFNSFDYIWSALTKLSKI